MPQDIGLKRAHYFIMNIPSSRDLKHIASNHSTHIEFKDFMRLYKDYTKEPFSFLMNNTTLPSDNPLRFRKNLLLSSC